LKFGTLIALAAVISLAACTARFSTIRADEKGISWEVTVRDDYKYDMLEDARQRAATHCQSFGKAASNVEFIVNGQWYKYYPGATVGFPVETVGTVTAACYDALRTSPILRKN